MLSRRSIIVSGGAFAAAAAIGYGLWPRMDTYQAFVEGQRRALLPEAGLAELVRMGTLAANGHNTQPWLFRLDSGRVTILPDFTRRTKVVDPDDHHLFVSLGCATGNIGVAAPALGRAASVTIENGAEPRILIDLAAGPTVETPLYRAIPLRQSTRAVFDGQPVSADDLRLLRAAAAEEGVEVEIFTEAADREAILEFVVAGNSAQIDDPAFVAELRDWIRFTPDQALLDARRSVLRRRRATLSLLPGWRSVSLAFSSRRMRRTTSIVTTSGPRPELPCSSAPGKIQNTGSRSARASSASLCRLRRLEFETRTSINPSKFRVFAWNSRAGSACRTGGLISSSGLAADLSCQCHFVGFPSR